MEVGQRKTRRRHGREFKAAVIAQCSEPGASIASVALAHGLNANLVHRWLRVAQGRALAGSLSRVDDRFVPVPIAAPQATSTEINIELRRSGLVAAVRWPVSESAQCAIWLRELLR